MAESRRSAACGGGSVSRVAGLQLRPIILIANFFFGSGKGMHLDQGEGALTKIKGNKGIAAESMNRPTEGHARLR